MNIAARNVLLVIGLLVTCAAFAVPPAVLEAENPKSQFVFSQEAQPPDEPLTLWYRRPATKWETEALPVGNGRLAAMVFGRWTPRGAFVAAIFFSLANALREAGFDVPIGEERLERAVEQGATLARRLGRLPKMADWKAARSALRPKIERLLELLARDPFETPPPFEKLVGDLEGAFSRRVNIQHRLVYQVLTRQRVVKVLRMWTHYE